MRRIYLAVAAGLTTLVLLAGCGTVGQKAPEPAPVNFIPLAGQPIDTPDKFFEEIDGVKHFYLYIEEKEHELLKGVTVPVWSFNGTVPGPQIVVDEGDQVKVHFRNTSSQPHSIHLHGQAELEMLMDGVPDTSHAVLPGDEFVYEFTASTPGTHMYHCHVGTFKHVEMGMYGALIVNAKDEVKTWDHDHTIILDDWDTNLNPFDSARRHSYNYFTVNGKSFPESPVIEGKAGETVRVRFMNMGYSTFSMHSHGYGPVITHLDGYPVPQPYQRDVFTINPGERVDVLFTLKEGIYPWHDHQLEHVLNDGRYLGGATFLVIGTP